MTRSPGDNTPRETDETVRMPSFMAADETRLATALPLTGELSTIYLPGYEFVQELHRGGQGVVFLALQKSTHRKVAIKVMKEGPFASADDRARFDREVRILARLKHPNIVTIHDSGRAAGCDYFVMDYVQGESLADHLHRKHSASDLVDLFRRICEAVQSAHDHGIVHRDLKPSNICIDSNGEPHILDFGLAKTPGSALEPGGVTQSGFFVGSIPWASPEQADGHVTNIDARTDVYCLGVIFYFMLTNRFPYDINGSPAEVLSRVAHADPIRPRSASRKVDSELETIMLKCLQKDPIRRYANAGEIAADLAAYQSGRPISARRDSLAYLFRKSAAQSMRSRPFVSKLILAAIAIAIAYVIVRPLVFEYVKIDLEFRRYAANWLPANSQIRGSEFEHTRVIALTDKTDLAAIAQREHLKGVNPAIPASHRGMHGRLLKRLSLAHPSVVVWDAVFRKPGPFDAAFVEGAAELQKVGVDIVVAAPSWSLDANGLPDISPQIAAKVRWGCYKADLDRHRPWTLELFFARRNLEPRGSLALVAYGASKQPGHGLTIDYASRASETDSVGRRLYLSYWLPQAGSPERKSDSSTASFVDYTALQTQEARKDEDLRRGDAVGMYLVVLPPDPVLKASTVEYGDVFTASEQQLRAWFEGRVVVFGDQRSTSTDWHPYRDGRRIAGSYAQAVGIDAMRSGLAIQMPANWVSRPLTILGGLVGALGVALISRGVIRFPVLIATTILMLLIITFAAFAASLTALRSYRYLCNPIVPLAAVWIAAALAVGVEGVRNRSGRNHPSRSTP